MEFDIKKYVAATCFSGNMHCVMAIAQENFKPNFYYLHIRRNGRCPFTCCGKIWGIKGDCDWCFRHFSIS
jgi:hypothetical protein